MSDVADNTLEEIIAKLRGIAPAIRAHGVTRLAVFGSRARGNARPDSDLDILVDTVAGGTLPAFDHLKVVRLIEDATGLQTPDIDSGLVEAAHHGADCRRFGRGVLNAANH